MCQPERKNRSHARASAIAALLPGFFFQALQGRLGSPSRPAARWRWRGYRRGLPSRHLGLDGVDQGGLRHLLLGQSLHDPLVDGTLGDDVLDHHGLGGLPLPPEAGVRLLVELQRPREAEPHEGGASGLKVEAVACGGRMYDCHRNPSRIPVVDVAARLDLPDVEALLHAGEVVAEPVGHQQGLPVRGLDDVLQSVQLPVVELDGVTGVRVDGSVCQLAELPGEGGRVCGGDLAVRELQDELLLPDPRSARARAWRAAPRRTQTPAPASSGGRRTSWRS